MPSRDSKQEVTPKQSKSPSPPKRKSTLPSQIDLPPPETCARIDHHVRSNPSLSAPWFDFAEHVRNRSYVTQNIQFGENSDCAVLLDAGVYALLTKVLDVPFTKQNVKQKFGFREAKGKGTGMFATRDIKPGQTILAEHPIVVIPYILGLSAPLGDVYADLFERLPQSTYEKLMDLAGRGPTLFGAVKDIMDINALAINLDVPEVPHPELSIHRGIFLNTSRCNHSCGPNAKWTWDSKSFSLSLTAVRTIPQGEEITISYIKPDESRQQRVTTLYDQYRFHCQCPHCIITTPSSSSSSSPSGSSSTSMASKDLARYSLSQIWDAPGLPSFEEWCLDPTSSDDILINAHIRALQFITQEGLESLDTGPGTHPGMDVGRHLDRIAMCYGALQDVENFRYWISLVKVCRTLYKPEQAIVFNKWLSNPAAFPVWGWRRGSCDSSIRKHSSSSSRGIFDI